MDWIQTHLHELQSNVQPTSFGSTLLFKEYLTKLIEALNTNNLDLLVSEKLRLNQKISTRIPHNQLIQTMIDIEDATMFVADEIQSNSENTLDQQIRMDWKFALDKSCFLNEYGVRQQLIGFLKPSNATAC
jgi:hypothetical protein